MFQLSSYTSHYLGPRRGTLIHSPSGQTFHIIQGVVNELPKPMDFYIREWDCADKAWRDNPCNEALKLVWKDMALLDTKGELIPCPVKQGKALDVVMHMAARVAIYTFERWILTTIPPSRWEKLSLEQQWEMMEAGKDEKALAFKKA